VKPHRAVCKKPLERVVLASALRLLRRYGCKVFRRNVGGEVRYYRGKRRFVSWGQPGAADLWGILPDKHSRHFECEIKRPGKRPRARQVKWLRTMNSPGTPAFWTDNLEDLERIIRALIQGGRVEFIQEVKIYRERGRKLVELCGDFEVIL
jgi:hypothetical protein